MAICGVFVEFMFNENDNEDENGLWMIIFLTQISMNSPINVHEYYLWLFVGYLWQFMFNENDGGNCLWVIISWTQISMNRPINL